MAVTKEYHYIRKTFRFDGKRYCVYGKSEEEAITKKVQLMAELTRGERTTGANITVCTWYQQWKSLYKESSDLTTKSLSTYDEKYRKYIHPAIGHMRLKDVRDFHLQRILNSQAGKSHSHLTKLRSTMQQMFSRARTSRLIAFDPSEDLALPVCHKGTRRSLTERERQVFLELTLQMRGGILFYTMLCTGMRPGELIALQWRDINFQTNEIHVCRALESGSWNTLKPPKTAAGTRIIPMRAELRERLLPLRGEPMSPVFLNRAGNMHSHASFNRLWSKLKHAMLEQLRSSAPTYGASADDLVPYCLRHTFCTDLQRAGIPINVAKDLMGHSDISVTANIYTHRDTDLLHESIAQMDRYSGEQREHAGVKFGVNAQA